MKCLYLLFMSMTYTNAFSFIPRTFLSYMSRSHILMENSNINQFFENIQKDKIQELIISNQLNKIYSIVDSQNINWIKTHPVTIQMMVQRALEENIPIQFIQELNIWNTIQNPFMIIPILILFGYILVQTNEWFRYHFALFFYNFLNWNPFDMLTKINMIDQQKIEGWNETEINKIIKMSKKKKYQLDDWIGSPEVKEECLEIIDFIQQKDRFKETHTLLPKGILLEGSPGTGKTLFAKIIASETDAHFISISGSEFVELYVGVGASRIRKLFQEARKKKPSIIFIDEIDAIGRQRVTHSVSGNEEREQTLNQLLFEMDGFQSNDDIFIMAATNRVDILDKALLRPGRFDRIIQIPLPDHSSRVMILKHYLQSKPVDSSLNLEDIATFTEGYSGAQLFNIINEASISSIKQNETFLITYDNIMKIIEKKLVGIPKKIENRPYDVLKRIAIHEIGHAFLSIYFSKYFDFKKVTIQSTYQGTGGYTLYLDKSMEAKYGLYTKEILKQKVIILLGGRIAEDLYYGKNNSSIGASQDLQIANQLIHHMIYTYGFSSNMELYHTFSNDPHELSETLKYQFEKERVYLLYEAYLEGKEILNQYKPSIDIYIEKLIKEKTLYPCDFLEI